MAKPILVDTDVLVDFFRGYPKASAFVDSCASRIILAATAEVENAELKTLNTNYYPIIHYSG